MSNLNKEINELQEKRFRNGAKNILQVVVFVYFVIYLPFFSSEDKLIEYINLIDKLKYVEVDGDIYSVGFESAPYGPEVKGNEVTSKKKAYALDKDKKRIRRITVGKYVKDGVEQDIIYKFGRISIVQLNKIE